MSKTVLNLGTCTQVAEIWIFLFVGMRKAIRKTWGNADLERFQFVKAGHTDWTTIFIIGFTGKCYSTTRSCNVSLCKTGSLGQ